MVNEFDLKAKDWDSDENKIRRAKAVANAILSGIPVRRDFRALEYGCGTGLLSFFLHPYISEILLADNSKGMLDKLRERIKAENAGGMIPVDLDLELTGPLEEKFDLIYTLMTMHHISDVDRLLGKFQAMLRPGGYLAVADLDAEDGSFHGAGFAGHKGFDRKELTAQAERAGFAAIKFTTAYHTPRIRGDNTVRLYPVFLMTALRN
jgi:SAM-dependent methyltransferase